MAQKSKISTLDLGSPNSLDSLHSSLSSCCYWRTLWIDSQAQELPSVLLLNISSTSLNMWRKHILDIFPALFFFLSSDAKHYKAHFANRKSTGSGLLQQALLIWLNFR